MMAGILVGSIMIAIGLMTAASAVTWGLMQRKAANKKSGRARMHQESSVESEERHG